MNSLNPNSISFSQRSSIAAIRFYQLCRPALSQVVISSFGVASQCKHNPSCSDYAIEAIRRHGTIAGVAIGLTRILACR